MKRNALALLERAVGLPSADPDDRLVALAGRVSDATLRAAAATPRPFCRGCVGVGPLPAVLAKCPGDLGEMVRRSWANGSSGDPDCATARRDNAEGESCASGRFVVQWVIGVAKESRAEGNDHARVL